MHVKEKEMGKQRMDNPQGTAETHTHTHTHTGIYLFSHTHMHTRVLYDACVFEAVRQSITH